MRPLTAVWLLLAAPPARGQQTLVAPPIDVVGAADEVEPAGAPASAFASHVRFHRVQDEGRTLAEELEALPSLHVRSLGGLGAYASLSIRGSSASQVLLLVDGVPITPATDALVSLGDLPVDAFQSANVYRGVAPVALGGGAIGGVVDLRTFDGDRVPARLVVTAGSFGTLRIAASSPARLGPLRGLARSSLLVSAGDFEFFDDRGTRQNTSDDSIRTRRNNAFETLEGGLAGRIHLGPRSRLAVSTSLSARRAGVPGLGTFQADRARSRSVGAIASVAWRRSGASASFAPRLALRAGATAFEDRDDEVGLGAQDRRDATLFGELALPFSIAALGGVVELAVAASIERTAAGDPLSTIPPPGPLSRRIGRVGASFERRFGDATLLAAGGVAAVEDDWQEGSGRIEPTGSAGLRIDVLPALSLRANATAMQRSPTFEELFGNSGAVQGNADLRPERALGADAGLVAAVASLHLSLAAYWRETFDLIQFVLTSQRTARPANLGKARLRGLEAGALWRPSGPLSAELAYGWLVAENLGPSPSDQGKRVPGRPEHDLHARFGARIGPASLSADVDVVSGNFLDPANYQEVPTRIYAGATASVAAPFWRSASLALTVRNVFDHIVADVPLRPPPLGGKDESPQAVGDFGGFPLPGRTVLLTLRIAEPNEETTR